MSRHPYTITESLCVITDKWSDLLNHIAVAAYGASVPKIGSRASTAPAPPGRDDDTKTPSGVPLPGGTDRLSLAAAIRIEITYWTRAVLDEHACATTLLSADDIPGTGMWLIQHTAWIESQVDGPEAAHAFNGLARAIEGLTNDARVRRPTVGACPHVIDGQPCYGAVRAQLGHDTDSRELLCDADSDHAWSSTRWEQLHRDMEARADPDRPPTPARMNAAELADWMSRHFGRPFTPQQIRQWVARKKIPRGDDGLLDRAEAAHWYVDWRATRIGA